MAQITSVYADVWRALYRLGNEAVWPNPVAAGAKPMAAFLGGWGKDAEPVEGMLVVTSVKPVDNQSWVTTNFGRDEQFATEVEIKTALRGRDQFQALDRLEQLTIVFEQIVLTGTRRATQPVEVKSLAWWWGITAMETVVWPLVDGGYGAAARFTITVTARIGGT